MYVRDLEMKSRYLEAECIRLGRLLQCCYAQNQALRFSMQMSNASGAPMAKQESAVLLMGKKHEPTFTLLFLSLAFMALWLSFHMVLRYCTSCFVCGL